MKSLFKEKVIKLLELKKELSTLPHYGSEEYGYEMGYKIKDADLPALMDEAIEDKSFLTPQEIVSLETAKLILKKKFILREEEQKVQSKKFKEVDKSITDIEVEIESIYSSLTKEEKLGFVYQSFRLKHLSDVELVALKELLKTYEIEYHIFSGRISMIISIQYSRFLTKLQEDHKTIFLTFTQFSQPVKFDGFDFHDGLLPLIPSLIK